MATNRPPKPSTATAGRSTPMPDVIEFIPVPDEAARVAGLQAGDYHVHTPTEIGNDQYEVLNGAPGIVAEILPPTEWDVFFLNWESPMTGNLAMRQAIQASMDHLPILQSARGGDDFIRLDPSLMMTQTPWHSTGRRGVLQHQRSGARQGEAAGSRIRRHTAPLPGDPGIHLHVRRGDRPQATARGRRDHRRFPGDRLGDGAREPRQEGRLGDFHHEPRLRARPDPDLLRRSDEHLSRLVELREQSRARGGSASESDFDTRKGICDQIQTAAYTEIPSIKVGDASTVSFRSDQLGGWDAQFERGPKFWNFWLKS